MSYYGFSCPYFRQEFICPECGAKFSTREGLRSHIYKSHIDKFDAFIDQLSSAEYFSPLMNNDVNKGKGVYYPQIYVDNDYMLALKTADQYLYAWMTRNGAMAYDLISDNIKKEYKDRKDFEMSFSGTSNPHHEAFEIAGDIRMAKDRIRFRVWLYYHYTGACQPPFERPNGNTFIELVKIDEKTWLVDKVFSST